MLTTFNGLLAYGPESDSANGGSGFVTLVIYAVVIGGLFYFLMIRPQRTRSRRQQQLVDALEIGDEVTTIGGIFGIIEHMDDESVVLQIEGGGRIRVVRRALAGKVDG
ncbi:MAG: preprotein translocase subunit YajC [Acidimicrobiia bacterium]